MLHRLGSSLGGRCLQGWSSSTITPTAGRAGQSPVARRQFTTSSRRWQQQWQQQQQRQQQQQQQQQQQPGRPVSYSKKNTSTMYYSISIIIGTIALAYGSVPFYKMLCQQVGFNGQPIQVRTDEEGSSASRMKPVTSSRRLRITFNGSVSDVLPWKFTPQQREVRVLPGETALAFYTAENKGDDDIIGVATYSVTPAKASPYFSKIQCFCFEEQMLNAGETVDMPVFFFIDPDFVTDPAMHNVNDITLSYTFFKARYNKDGVLRPIPGMLAS